MMNDTQNIYYGKIVNEIGEIYIASTDKGLSYVGSPNEGLEQLKKWFDKSQSNIAFLKDEEKIGQYTLQISDYLNGQRKEFDIVIDVKGTPFQEMVWHELRNIPYGETASYSDIADKIGKPKAVRAVGRAIGANPLLMVIPCHRVVAKNGNLTGFRGGMLMKEKLLEMEAHS